jgi:hypothetical protein
MISLNLGTKRALQTIENCFILQGFTRFLRVRSNRCGEF